MNEWYKNNLGLQTSDWGTSFDWRYDDDRNRKDAIAWAKNTKNHGLDYRPWATPA